LLVCFGGGREGGREGRRGSGGGGGGEGGDVFVGEACGSSVEEEPVVCALCGWYVWREGESGRDVVESGSEGGEGEEQLDIGMNVWRKDE